MKKNFTKNDLILLVYNELPESRRLALEAAIQQDYELRQEYNQLMKFKLHLDELKANPNPSTIDIILEESGSYSSLKAH